MGRDSLVELAGVDLLHVAGDALAIRLAGDLVAVGGVETRGVAAHVAGSAGQVVVFAHDHAGCLVGEVVLHAAALHEEFEVLAAHLLGVSRDLVAQIAQPCVVVPQVFSHPASGHLSVQLVGAHDGGQRGQRGVEFLRRGHDREVPESPRGPHGVARAAAGAEAFVWPALHRAGVREVFHRHGPERPRKRVHLLQEVGALLDEQEAEVRGPARLCGGEGKRVGRGTELGAQHARHAAHGITRCDKLGAGDHEVEPLGGVGDDARALAEVHRLPARRGAELGPAAGELLRHQMHRLGLALRRLGHLSAFVEGVDPLGHPEVGQDLEEDGRGFAQMAFHCLDPLVQHQAVTAGDQAAELSLLVLLVRVGSFEDDDYLLARLFARGVHEIEDPSPGGRGELKARGLFEQVGHDRANQRISIAARRAGSMRRGHLTATVRLGHAERPHSRIVLITLFDDPAGRFQEGERAVPGDVVFPASFWRVGRGIRRGQRQQPKRNNGHEY